MSLEAQATSSIKWTSLAQVIQQVLQFVTSVVLARLLLPSDFGLMTMALVVIGFLSIFKDLGTSAAIIRQDSLSEPLLASIFWINALIGFGMMAGLFITAPLFADVYREPRVVPLVRALSVVFFVSSLSILQKALLERNFAFQTLAKLETGVTVAGSVAGITTALLGAGVWSLIIKAAVEGVLSTVLLGALARYRPSCSFQWRELRCVSAYSLNLTGFNIANYFTRNADYVLIGRFLGAQQLGYYTLAYRLMLFPLQNISSVIGRVMFPVLSRLDGEQERFQRAYLSAASCIAYFSFPLMLGLCALSEPFVLAVYGNNWKPVIVLLMILAPLGMLQSIGTTTGAIFQAKGHTDWMFRWGLASGLLCVLSFIVGLRWGIIGVSGAYAVAGVILFYPNFAIPFRLIHLNFRSLLDVLVAPFLGALAMLTVVICIRSVLQSYVSEGWLLALAIPAGGLVYLISSWMTNRETVQQSLEVIGLWPQRFVNRTPEVSQSVS
jgi:lipopolysaccharide exporter